MKTDEYYSRRGCEKFILGAILWIIIMPILIFVSIRCEENEEFCWDCEISVITKSEGFVLIETVERDTLKCGFTEHEIRNYEKWKTSDEPKINYCGILKWQECICVKQ